MDSAIWDYKQRASSFETQSKDIFSIHETSGYRTGSVEKSLEQLQGLSVKQEELLKEAIKSIKHELYRSAHVAAWAAFIDFFEQKMASDGLLKLKSLNPDFSKFKSIEDIREKITEHQLIEYALKLGLIKTWEARILHGELVKRNKCAHPSDYKVNQNITLGYVNGLMDWIDKIMDRSL